MLMVVSMLCVCVGTQKEKKEKFRRFFRHTHRTMNQHNFEHEKYSLLVTASTGLGERARESIRGVRKRSVPTKKNY